MKPMKHIIKPIKTLGSQISELPCLVLHTDILGREYILKLWKLRNCYPLDLIHWVSSFANLTCILHNKTTIINIVLVWVLWVKPRERVHEKRRGSGSSRICSQLVRNSNNLANSQIVSQCLTQDSLTVNDALNLWNLKQPWEVRVRISF